MSVHLNKEEYKLLKLLDKYSPGGVERTNEIFDSATTLEDLGFAKASTIGFCKVGLQITEDGKQYLREAKANRFSGPMKIVGGIVTLILIPILVNLISDYVLPLLFG